MNINPIKIASNKQPKSVINNAYRLLEKLGGVDANKEVKVTSRLYSGGQKLQEVRTYNLSNNLCIRYGNTIKESHGATQSYSMLAILKKTGKDLYKLLRLKSSSGTVTEEMLKILPQEKIKIPKKYLSLANR